MRTRIAAILAVTLVALIGCQKPDEAEPETTPTTPQPAAGPATEGVEPSFVNIVWQVKESQQVAPGSLRVFLSDETLVMADPNGTPAFGSWGYVDGRLHVVEEGRRHDVDILALTETELRIRIHGPGEPVEILFAPAAHPSSVAAVMGEVTMSGAHASAPDGDVSSAELAGSAWRLENLAGAGVLDRVQATLEFATEGRIAGSGSCNRFNGIVSFDGNTVTIGGIAATRMACPEAVMRQEEAYFAALRDSERFTIAGESLQVFVRNQAEPLRFTAMPATKASATNTVSRAPASTTSSLNGIWTIVDHHIPGVSAMSGEQARARHGESIRLTDSVATSSGASCREPRYATRQVSADAYLASGFQLPPGSLPPLAGRGQVRVMEVSCGNADWAALGATLLEMDRDHALAPWDGVFFVLERDRDFRGLGQEPGWQLEIRKGSEMRFTYDYGKASVATPAPRARADATTGTRSFQARTEAHELTVEIVPVRCEDSMSGRSFPTTVTVTLDGRSFRGCGEPLATPYQG